MEKGVIRIKVASRLRALGSKEKTVLHLFILSEKTLDNSLFLIYVGRDCSGFSVDLFCLFVYFWTAFHTVVHAGLELSLYHKLA